LANGHLFVELHEMQAIILNSWKIFYRCWGKGKHFIL